MVVKVTNCFPASILCNLCELQASWRFSLGIISVSYLGYKAFTSQYCIMACCEGEMHSGVMKWNEIKLNKKSKNLKDTYQVT